ncbi:unnamed protein product [Blepharisma stoltei]|uniref:Uncharacterized protein n=1 Tax=Blepharisma stoltei TaxID=1481888 RepID=A0AAU9IIU4_9CILI|nr:unnamed protein product [Blepharisma stoltei]
MRMWYEENQFCFESNNREDIHFFSISTLLLKADFTLESNIVEKYHYNLNWWVFSSWSKIMIKVAANYTSCSSWEEII